MENNKDYSTKEQESSVFYEENAEDIIIPESGSRGEDTAECEHVCSVCRGKAGSDAAVLTMSGYGNPRYLCYECEALLDTATGGDDFDKIAEATEEISARLAKANCEDTVVLEELNVILRDAARRAKAIKDGSYDFSLDEDEDDGIPDEVPEELAESREDRALDEKDARANRILDSIFSWAAGLLFAGLVIYFVIKFVI
jgi:hypothetical protein